MSKIAYSVLTIVVALSGWFAILYQWYTSTPKIQGEALNVLVGELIINGKKQTVFFPYLYLVNSRKNAVHILDYEMEVDTGDGYRPVKRIYGLRKDMTYSFLSQEMDISIPDFYQKLIYANNDPVEYGKPLHGFVGFADDRHPSTYYRGKTNFKITCIDAFKNRHVIYAKNNDLAKTNLYLLNDIAGIKVTQR